MMKIIKSQIEEIKKYLKSSPNHSFVCADCSSLGLDTVRGSFPLPRKGVCGSCGGDWPKKKCEPHNPSGKDLCSICAAPETKSNTPWTTYLCGGKDYDRRPGTITCPKKSD